jgi:hypothetical protein
MSNPLRAPWITASIVASLTMGTAALADAPRTAPSGATIALSDDEREAALEAGATRAAQELPINGLDRKVHGEVGMEIGTGGYRAMYGTAVVPIGQTGYAQFSFMNGQMGRLRR